MSVPSESLIEHYTQSGLLASIEAGLAAAGKSVATVTVDDLGPVDEFHVGGRSATTHLVGQLGLTTADHVLDIGCGLGGPARFVAGQAGRVTGIDLTPEYIEVGTKLNGWVGLSDSIELHTASALEMPFEDAAFDVAYMMHVGMNISDKRTLMREVARVLRPGGRFGIYDLMLFAPGGLKFPLPWSTDATTSHLAGPEVYQETAAEAGLIPVSENNRHRQAIEFLDAAARSQASIQAARQERIDAGEQPGPAGPPLGLQLVMGPTFGEKFNNMASAIRAEQIAPVEMLFTRM